MFNLNVEILFLMFPMCLICELQESLVAFINKICQFGVLKIQYSVTRRGVTVLCDMGKCLPKREGNKFTRASECVDCGTGFGLALYPHPDC